MAAPLAALCVVDVSQRCAGKTGLRGELCESFWKFEAAKCPDAARVVHQRCVASVQRLEKSDDVCKWGEKVLAPGVEKIAEYVKDPGLKAQFEQEWPGLCSSMQTSFAQNVGDGEKICTEIENAIIKLVSKKSYA